MSADDGRIQCATYTHARRHPIVLGKIGDWTPPFQLTLVQTGVLVTAFLVEARTWRTWAPLLPGPLAVVVAVALPGLLAWAVRASRIEGRSLLRLAAGLVRYAVAPRRGQAGGRPRRPGRPMATGFAVVVEAGWADP